MNSNYEDILSWAKNLPDDELNFAITRYCGPNNVILREKEFGYELSKKIQKILIEELLFRQIDETLLTS